MIQAGRESDLLAKIEPLTAEGVRVEREGRRGANFHEHRGPCEHRRRVRPPEQFFFRTGDARQVSLSYIASGDARRNPTAIFSQPNYLPRRRSASLC
jgi:hypothetical protein